MNQYQLLIFVHTLSIPNPYCSKFQNFIFFSCKACCFYVDNYKRFFHAVGI